MLSHDMVAMEKAGIPSRIAPAVRPRLQPAVDGGDTRDRPFVTIPPPVQAKPDYIHRMVERRDRQLILGLTRMSSLRHLGVSNRPETAFHRTLENLMGWMREPFHGERD